MRELVVLVLSGLMLLTTAQVHAEAMSVQVKQAPLRQMPTPFGRIVAKLAYGEQVEQTREQRGWVEVRSESRALSGWLHASALTDEEIELSAGDSDANVGASSSEIALAGKGFSAEVESEYKRKRKLDYTWVDRMERIEVTDSRKQAFLDAGGLLDK
jgi:hypothetical protein